MSLTIFQVITSTLLAMPVASHMLLQTPPARWSKFNPDYVKAGKVDYNLHSPLGGPLGTRLPFPCGHSKGPISATLKAGQPVKWSLFGGATHNGGHCEISLSYDDKTFVSIQTILGNCMKDGKLNYEVTIPADAPSGNATFAWTWVNWTGNREYYMNCADVTIEGNPNGVLTGPKIVEANMPGRPTIPAFANARTGAELYENRPIVSVTGKGASGPPVPPPTIPAKPSTTIPYRPEPTTEKSLISKPPVTKSTYPSTTVSYRSEPTTEKSLVSKPPVTKPSSESPVTKSHFTTAIYTKPQSTTTNYSVGESPVINTPVTKPSVNKPTSMPPITNYRSTSTIALVPEPTTNKYSSSEQTVINTSITKPLVTVPTSKPQYPTTIPSKPESTTGMSSVSEGPVISTSVTKPSATMPTSESSAIKPQPTSEPTRPEYPEPTQDSDNGKCEHGKWECKGSDYHVCVWGVWQERNCPSTTKCYQVTPFNILCL